MGSEISCPSCGQPVTSQSRYCEHCGADLAVAAVLAEQSVIIPGGIPNGTPIAPELLVPRVGEYMIEQGFVTQEDLQRALAYQKEQAANGSSILIGQALLELGIVEREILDQVITSQILKLQKALSESNQQLQRRVEERTQELQRALERLSELNQLKSNFIANISHELRTPLTHIKGYLDILGDGGLGPLTEAQAEAVGVLNRAELRLERLIEDLIQFSLASRGEVSLTLKNSDIGKLVQIAVDRSMHKAQTQNIQLTCMVQPDLPIMQIDEDKIGWVLIQLLDNALKFTPKGGKVAIKARNTNGVVSISVLDTGIGIPENKISEIFEPFHQLDGDATRRYAGTGLGLAMVRRIVEAHGSQVKVQSAVGKGSRFEFSLSTRQEILPIKPALKQ
jgi:signal transduction histidine kinase